MIRIDLGARPEAWHTVQIAFDGELVPLKVKYWLYDKAKVDEIKHVQLERAKAAQDDGKDAVLLQVALEETSPEREAERRSELLKRIVDWDLQDANSSPAVKVPVTPENIAAVLDQARFAEPLWLGLLAASNGRLEKND